jgi:hypothetical protein
VAYLQANAEEIWLEALHIRASQEEREIGAMTDQELQKLEHYTLDELGAVLTIRFIQIRNEWADIRASFSDGRLSSDKSSAALAQKPGMATLKNQHHP